MANGYKRIAKRARSPLKPTKLSDLTGRTIVIKYGGAALERRQLRKPTVRDIAALQHAGGRLVLVHGGSRQLDRRMKELGLEVRSSEGLRYTCAETIKEAETVFGKINAEIIALLHGEGVDAVGLGTRDQCVICAEPKSFETYGYVGDVKSVDVASLRAVMDEGAIPVVYALGRTADEQLLNINADDVACAVASSLRADGLMLITDVEGVFQDPDDPSSLLTTITHDDIKTLLKEHVVSRGMIRKVAASLEAIENGVSVVHILSAQQPNALITEVTGESHYGTRIIGKSLYTLATT